MRIRRGRLIADGAILALSLLVLAWGHLPGYTFPVTDIAEAAVEAVVDPILWLAAAGVAHWISGKQYGLLYAVVLGIVFAVGMHHITKLIYSTWLRLDHAIALGLGRFLVFMLIVSVIDMFWQWNIAARTR